MIEEPIQGTDEWRQLKCGFLGASRIADALAKTKSGWGASRANLMAQLIAERLTGEPQDSYTNQAMEWGTETEPLARIAYEFRQGVEVTECSFILHPTIATSGASPDGLVGEDGLVEIKCPNTATHIETLLGGAISGRYIMQMMWQMACTGRQWCDWVSFDPRMPEYARLYIRRVSRDDALISSLEKDVRDFLGELDAKIAAINTRYGMAPAEVVRAQLESSLRA